MYSSCSVMEGLHRGITFAGFLQVPQFLPSQDKSLAASLCREIQRTIDVQRDMRRITAHLLALPHRRDKTELLEHA